MQEMEFLSSVTNPVVTAPPSLESLFPRCFQVWSEAEKSRVTAQFFRRYPKSGLDAAALFPFFLANQKWSSGQGFLPDLGALEWAMRLASQAPDIPCSGFERVVSASEPEWFQARFRFDPAHAVMQSDWPLDEIFQDPIASYQRRPGKFLIFRNSGQATFRAIDSNEALLIESLSLGVPLGVILDRPKGPDFDSFLFHDWIQSGFLREITWPQSVH